MKRTAFLNWERISPGSDVIALLFSASLYIEVQLAAWGRPYGGRFVENLEERTTRANDPRLGSSCRRHVSAPSNSEAEAVTTLRSYTLPLHIAASCTQHPLYREPTPRRFQREINAPVCVRTECTTIHYSLIPKRRRLRVQIERSSIAPPHKVVARPKTNNQKLIVYVIDRERVFNAVIALPSASMAVTSSTYLFSVTLNSFASLEAADTEAGRTRSGARTAPRLTCAKAWPQPTGPASI